VASFGGIPSTDGFTKRYELHFQPKKVVVNRAEVRAQYGCINFHTKHYGAHGAKLTVDSKKKWAGGWTREWFLCKVPLLRSPGPMRGKVIYALCSSMFALDFSMDPSFECAGNDAEDVCLSVPQVLLVAVTLLKNTWHADYFCCRSGLALGKSRMGKHQCQR
jgi:hypothetical protein